MRLQGPSSTPQPPSSSKRAVGKPRVGWQETCGKARGDALLQQFRPFEWERVNSGAYYNPFKSAASTLPDAKHFFKAKGIVYPERFSPGCVQRCETLQKKVGKKYFSLTQLLVYKSTEAGTKFAKKQQGMFAPVALEFLSLVYAIFIRKQQDL
jgi:hypothetical protein